VIEDGVKTRQLIQVGHNVRIGKHTAIAAVRHRRQHHIGATAPSAAARHPGAPDDRRQRHISAVAGDALDPRPGHYTGFFPIDDNAAWEKNAATLKQLHSLRER
jgi:UDP-3-O-[3-hydroxymyristoyl] glucosamine N-acyltransferase